MKEALKDLVRSLADRGVLRPDEVAVLLGEDTRLRGVDYDELIRQTLRDAVAFGGMERAQLEDFQRWVAASDDEGEGPA